MNKFNLFLLLFLMLPLSVNSADVEENHDNRPFFLHEDKGSVPLMLYREFLECLRTADFAPDHGPREIQTNIKRLVMTKVNNETWAFDIREYPEKIILIYIAVDVRNIVSREDKLKFMLYIMSRCKFDEDRY